MAKPKIFDSSFNLVIDSTTKNKAMFVLKKQHGKNISAFLRECIFNLVYEYEKKNGDIPISQLSFFDEKK